MIKIIFEDGQLVECDHISRIYMDQEDLKKVFVPKEHPERDDDLVIDTEGEY